MSENWPQWVRSRMNSIRALPECKVTHFACRCFIERIAKLEAELAELRRQIKEGSDGDTSEPTD